MDERSTQADELSLSFHTEGYQKMTLYLKHEKGNNIRYKGLGGGFNFTAIGRIWQKFKR